MTWGVKATLAVTASPVYAIFDDNSAVGDERSIEMVFDGVLFILSTGAPRDISGNMPGLEVAQRIRAGLRSVQASRLLLEQLRDEVGVRGWNAAARSIRQR